MYYSRRSLTICVMKTLKALIYLLLFCAGIVAIIWFLYGLINNQLDALPEEAQQVENNKDQNSNTVNEGSSNSINSSESQTTNELGSETFSNATQSSSRAAKEVSTTQLAALQNSYFQTIGTVTSTGIVTVYPLTSGAVKSVNFQAGDYVQAGDEIVELTGTNLSEHVSKTQLKIAEATLENAKASLENLKKTSNQSIKTAGLQLQSAVNQASAIAYDLAIIEQNRASLDDSINILENSLDNTSEMNSRNRTKGVNDLDDMIFMLNDAQDARGQTQRQIDDLKDEIEELKDDSTPPRTEATNIPSSDSGTDSTTNPGSDSQSAEADFNSAKLAILEEQLIQLQAALATQDKGIEDVYSAINLSKHGLASAENGSELSENQIMAQLTQSKSQADVLDLTLQSTKTKLGYNGDSSDGLQLSQQVYNATKAQLETAIENTANQIKLAELNVEMAKSQTAALSIKAPFEGIITLLDVYPGTTIGPQQIVTEILDPKSFRLEVGVDINTANRIAQGIPAQIDLGGRRIDVPITSVGLKVDEKTKLVKVTMRLPNIFFKLNQNMKVYLPLSIGSGTLQNSRSLPLDAVIIGTEKQFIFVNDHGTAKQVEVELGEIAGDQVEIKTKLDPNMEIILEGAKDLVDGQTVEVIIEK